MKPLAAPPWLRDLAGAWIFYTVLPAWPRLQPRFERIARFAPWIGLLQGLLQGLLWSVAEPWLPGGARVALVLALGFWLTGGIHADGVMDTADGLAAGERALEAMDDSRVGASGVLALVQVLLLRAAALLTLAELNLGPLVALGLVWAGGSDQRWCCWCRSPWWGRRWVGPGRAGWACCRLGWCRWGWAAAWGATAVTAMAPAWNGWRA
jgi:adenosylcobinamide-GDP ribazoletransferase